MSDTIPVERLAAARQAMEGEERRKKREAENQILLRRREEARRAMEGEERRRKRETAVAVKQAAEEKIAQAAAAEAMAGAAARQTAQSAVAAEREKALAAAAAEAERRRQATAAAAQIAKLKTAPLMMDPIRTFKTDLTQAAAHGGSVSQAIIRGQNQTAGLPPTANQSPRDRSQLLLLTLIFLLLVLGAGIFVYLYWFNLAPPPAASKPPLNAAAADQLFIATDQQVKIALDDLTPAAAVLKLRQTLNDGAPAAGQMMRIIPAKNETALTWPVWLGVLPEFWPEKLKQTFDLKFLLGRYDDGRQPALFLLLKTKNYNEAFAALRAAETELPAAFYLLTGRAVFSPATTTPTFSNHLNRNLETRRLVKDGQTILLSAFLNQNFLILTENETAFSEIVKRWNDSVLPK